jgi:hypothetical protein
MKLVLSFFITLILGFSVSNASLRNAHSKVGAMESVDYASNSDSFQLQACHEAGADTSRGSEPVPWPFGGEAPFPWKDMPGIWKAERGSSVFYFTFEVINQAANGEQKMRIQQFDPESCEVRASGMGTEVDRVVHGVMQGKKHNYQITVRAFDGDNIANEFTTYSSGEYVTVLSVQKLNPKAFTYYYQLTKVLSDGLNCKLTRGEKK